MEKFPQIKCEKIDVASSYLKNLDLLSRFPELSFLHRSFVSQHELFLNQHHEINAKRENGSMEYLYSDGSIEEKVKNWRDSLDIEKIDSLYVYSIGLGYPYFALRDWLHDQTGRDLIFIEDDPSEFNAFLKVPFASQLLQDPKVHISFLFEGEDLDAKVRSLAQTFCTPRPDVVSFFEDRKKRFSELKLKILRRTTLADLWFRDRLGGHIHFQNFMRNLKQIPSSFYGNALKERFQNVPCILCGAGPSLLEEKEVLKSLENKALILAGGSAVSALSANGIIPHFGVALDPNFEEYLRFRASAAFEIPILYSTRVHPDVFLTFNGPSGYIRSAIGGVAELKMDEVLGLQDDLVGINLDEESLSVTTMGLAFAHYLGCNPIVLCGVDLAYTNMRSYAEGVVGNSHTDLQKMQEDKIASDRLFEVVDQRGEKVFTNVKWLMESKAISEFAKKMQEKVFINATKGGIGFEGLPYTSLKETAESFTKESDLCSILHATLMQASFSSPHLLIEKMIKELKESLLRSKGFTDLILQELEGMDATAKSTQSPRMFVAELDLKDETAYKILFYDLLFSLDRLFDRIYKGASPSLEGTQKKWKKFSSVVGEYLKAFD